MKLKGKLVGAIVGIAVITAALISAIFIHNMIAESDRQIEIYRQSLTESVERELKLETESAITVLANVYKRQQAGEFTEEQAKKLAADLVRQMRYDDGAGYFYIDTYDGVNVALLGRDAEGKSRINSQDSEGRYYIKEMIANGRNGGGYTDLMFAKPNESTPLPKRNYTEAFEPYQWVVGTGVWIDYIDSKVDQQQAAADEALHSQIIKMLIMLLILVILFAGAGVWISGQIVRPIQLVTRKLEVLATGDLRLDSSDETEVSTAKGKLANITSLASLTGGNDEVGIMSRAMQTLQKNISTMMKQIKDSAEEVAQSSQQLTENAEQSALASNQIADSIVNVAGSCNEQFTSVEDADTHVSKLSSNMESFKATINQAGSMVNDTKHEADAGSANMKNAVEQMRLIEQTVSESAKVIAELGEESNRIGSIVEAISGIAEQTNLLSLNAAIEAARAGEHGRGFAVVADEVRKLAEQSQDSAKEITQIIVSIQQKAQNAVNVMQEGVAQVENGVEAVNGAGVSFGDIASKVQTVVVQTQEMENIVNELAESTNTISDAVGKISTMSKSVSAEAQTVSAATEEQTATMSEIASASKKLASMAETMENAINKFKI